MTRPIFNKRLQADLNKLNERESFILLRTGQGFTGPEIAKELHLSPKTVDTYKIRTKLKLDVSHYNYRRTAFRFALQSYLNSHKK